MKTVRVILAFFGIFFTTASILGVLFDGSWMSPAVALLIASLTFLVLGVTFSGWEVVFTATCELVSRGSAYLQRVIPDAYHRALPHMGAGRVWAGGAAGALGHRAGVSFMAHMSLWLGIIAGVTTIAMFWWGYISHDWAWLHLALVLGVLSMACFIKAADGFPTLRRLAWEYVGWLWLLASILMCAVSYGHMTGHDGWGLPLFVCTISILLSFVTAVKGWRKIGRVLSRQEGAYICAFGWAGVLLLTGGVFYFLVNQANRFDWLEEEALTILNWGTSTILGVMCCLLFVILAVWLKKHTDKLAEGVLGTHD